MNVTTNELFNFLQGSDIAGVSSYDMWKQLNPDGTVEEFVNFLRTGSVDPEDVEQILVDAKAYIDEVFADLPTGGASTMEELTVTDTSGFVGEAGAEVNAQTLTDSLIARVNELSQVAEELSQL